MSEDIKKKKEKNSLFEIVKTILLAIVLAVLIKNFIFNTTMVMGESMEPTLHQNDRLICLVFPMYFSNPKQNDIVIIDAPDGSGQEYVKRVIGVPGDEIEIKEGTVFVNGIIKEENYIHPGLETIPQSEIKWTLEEDEFFVLGDNRNLGKSIDSRYFGPVEKKHINSIAWLRYMPFNKIVKF